MATGNCVECGKEVSSEAATCPHCGKPKPLMGSGGRIASDVVATVLAVFLGPVGLWYKGHWAAGFAWLIAGALLIAGTSFVLAVPVWIGMVIHAMAAKPR